MLRFLQSAGRAHAAVRHTAYADVRALASRTRIELSVAEADPESAITNLLYNHPAENELPEDVDGQLVSLLVEDEPGVLSRTSSLLSGRGYNIQSLSVYVAVTHPVHISSSYRFSFPFFFKTAYSLVHTLAGRQQM